MTKISVIIPVYKTEPWLLSCLKSVQNQSLKNWEAIIVIDASPDESLAIAKGFCDNDPRFKLVNLPQNLGLGGARNAGCSFARGDYLYFLDSDDLLPNDALQCMYNKILENDADLVIADFSSFQDGSETKLCLSHSPDSDATFKANFVSISETFTWHDLAHDYDLIMPSIITTTCWGKLFRRKLWVDLDCKAPGNLRMAEDFIPVKKFIFHADKITVLDLCVVYYRRRANSATTKRSVKGYEILRAYNFALDELFYHLENKDLKYFFELFYVRAMREHMFYLVPYNHWYDYFRQSAKITSVLDVTRAGQVIDGIDLKAWSRCSNRLFLKLLFFYFKIFLRRLALCWFG